MITNFRQSRVRQTGQKIEEIGRSGMWKLYEVELHFNTFFASSTPKNPKDIEAMLLARAPSDSALRRRVEEGEQITSLPELAEQVAEEVEATEEVERGYATFRMRTVSITKLDVFGRT